MLIDHIQGLKAHLSLVEARSKEIINKIGLGTHNHAQISCE